MPTRLPVVAAIPNYNMAKSLDILLPQVLTQDYDEVYILDDASTDNSLKVVKRYKQVKIVSGDKNLGPGGNRNRIIPVLSNEAILHFIDADVALVSQNNPEACRKLFADNDLGLVGGLIMLPDGTPWMFNYGPSYSLYSNIGGWLQAKIGRLEKTKPLAATRLRSFTQWWRKDFPNPLVEPSEREVFWVGEANMVIPSKLFAKVKGFDPQLRYHEAQDLAVKLHDDGYKVKFSPQVSVKHPYVDLNEMQRRAIQSRAGLQLIRKYGFHLK